VNVVLLLVLATDPTTEIAASAMAASAADGLEGRAHVELERVSKLPSDDEAVRRAEAAKASSVIEVSWPDADARRARLHALLKLKSSWIDRDVLFESTSAPWERGRAVGLAIAAMLPDENAPEKEPEKEPEKPPEPAVFAPTPVLKDSKAAPKPDVIEPPRKPPSLRVDLTVLGELGESFRGDPVGGGARVAGTYWFSPYVGVRVLGGARGSAINDVGASVTRFDGGAGLAVRLWGSTEGLRFAVYGDFRVARETVTRTRFDGEEERRGRTLPYVALTGEAGLALARHLGVVITVGSEVALGRTTLAVRDSAVGSLPRVALVGGLGLRWAF
jgi:hypothetical protein